MNVPDLRSRSSAPRSAWVPDIPPANPAFSRPAPSSRRSLASKLRYCGGSELTCPEPDTKDIHTVIAFRELACAP